MITGIILDTQWTWFKTVGAKGCTFLSTCTLYSGLNRT